MSKDLFKSEVQNLMRETGWSEKEATENLLAAVNRVRDQGEPEDAPDSPPSIRKGYRAAVRPVTEGVSEALGRFFQTMVPGSTKQFNQPAEGMSQFAGSMLAKGAIPQTPEQAALMLLAPGISRVGTPGGGLTQNLLKDPAKRLAISTGAGAGVAAGTGGNPLTGALTGAVSQVPAELTRGVGHLLTRGTQQGIADAANLGVTLGGISDDFAGIKTPGDYLRVVTLGQEATTQASNKLNAGLELVRVGLVKEVTKRLPPLSTRASTQAGKMPGHPYSPYSSDVLMASPMEPKLTVTNVPSLAKMYPERFGKDGVGITLQEADELFRDLGGKAFEDGAMRSGVKAIDIANARANAAREIKGWVQGYSPKLATFWENLSKDYARTQAVVRVLRQPDVIDGTTGRVNMRQLQIALRDPETSKDLQGKLSTEEVTRFYNSIFRKKKGLESADEIDTQPSMPQSISDTGRTAGALRAITQIRPRQYVGENAPQPSSLESLSKWMQRGGVAAQSAAGSYVIEP